MTNPKAESDHPVHQAIVQGDIESVSRYLAEGGSANVLDRYDCEPLYTAVKYDRLEIAEMLLAAGGNIFRRSRLRGDAWGAAYANWHTRMIDFCIRAGVDINALDRGRTVLDDMEDEKGGLAAESLPRWQAIHDQLVAMGARRAAEL